MDLYVDSADLGTCLHKKTRNFNFKKVLIAIRHALMSQEPIYMCYILDRETTCNQKQVMDGIENFVP